jgi:serine/threonine-protein kinase
VLTPDRWQIVEQLFHDALACAPAERRQLLDARCAGDPELRDEVQSLLAEESDADASASIAAAAAADWAARPADTLAGRTVEGFTIVSLLGAGGMGEIYVAEEIELRRRVALKLLPASVGADPGRVRRFEQEARAVSALNHPNILTVFRIGDVDGRRFIVTELIDGETVCARLANGPLALAEALDVATQAASALVAAHQAGIVHRDIKPENLMIRPDGYVKVLDFGLAKLMHGSGEHVRATMTRTGAVVGTVDYMAPEQAAGGDVDARADLYSPCVVLHEMVTGVLPRDSAFGSGSSSPAAVPPALKRLFGRGLRTDPSGRHQTASELLAELHAAGRTMASRAARARGLRWAGSAALVIAIAAAAALWRYPALRPFASDENFQAARVATTSLAVLPFQTVALGDEDQYLGLGIADAVITQLGHLSKLGVRPTTSVREFTQPDVDPIAVGRQLRVDHVLAGLIQRNGDRVRVTVQLVEVATGTQRWADRIDATFPDLFTLQDTVSQRVATALVTALNPNDRAGLSARRTRDPEAYQLYLQGRYFLARPGRADLEHSLSLFHQAVALDPRYALAYAGIASAHRTLGVNYTQGASPIDSMPLAREAALKALAIDPLIAEAHLVLGTVHFMFDWDWAAAEASYARAIELSPNFADAHRGRGWYLASTGAFDRGIAELRLAEQLDRTSALTVENLAIVLDFAGRSPEAFETINAAIRLEPGNARPISRLIWMLERQERFEEAFAARQTAWRTAGRPAEAERIGQVHAAGGYRAVIQDSVQRPGPRDAIAAAWAFVELGDRDAAIRELARGAEQKHTWTPQIKSDRRFAPLHGDARFDALLRRVGLSGQ